MDGVPNQQAPPAIGRVLKDSSFYLIGAVASRVAGFLFIPFYSHYLSPAQYGLIELVELSTQTIAMVLGLQAIGAALTRLFYDQPTPQTQQAVVSTSIIATGILSAAVMVLAVAIAGPLSQLVFHTDAWTSLLRAAFVAMFFSNMAEVVLVYERMRNNARFFLAYSLTSLVATLSLNILFIGVLGAGVWGFVSSKLITTIIGSAFLLLRMRRDVGWHWRSIYIPELVRFGAPLVLSSLSYFAIHFSDRFFLSAAVDLAELGRYALAYKFAILVSALVGDSFSKSWEATLYRYTGRPGWRDQFARIAAYLAVALFTTALALALYSPELLHIMVPADYFPPPLLLPILILSYVAREIGDFFRNLLLINKRVGRVSQIAASSAGVNLLTNLIFIPPFGIYGAAIATLVTWSAYMVACWAIANREHRLPIHPGAYLGLTALVSLFYALGTATRSSYPVLQFAVDGAWVLAFAGAAFWLFFSNQERQATQGLVLSIKDGLKLRLRKNRAEPDASGRPNDAP